MMRIQMLLLLAALAACRNDEPGATAVSASRAPSALSAEESSADPCGPGERRFAELDVCAKPTADGCFLASLAPTPRDAAAGPVAFRISNETGATLYVEGDFAANGPAFDLIDERARTATLMAEAQFCPVWCPDRGPVMEVDCGKPTPFMMALAPGATIETRWSGDLAASHAKSCDGGPARQCLEKAAAPAGAYRARFCAYSSISATAAAMPNATGRIDDARPTGEPACVETSFEAPSAAPVAVVFH